MGNERERGATRPHYAFFYCKSISECSMIELMI